jgi:Na+/H+-dicarboxylate symporter
MKPEPYIGKLPLTGASIDQISEKIEEYLNALEMERANVLRIRLSLEEALLRWRDRFGEKVFVTLELGTRWRRPTITLSLPGDSFDPLSASPDELGSWADTLLSNVGLLPRYSYTRGVNVLQLRLSRKRLNPAIGLLISGLAGIFTGLLGRAILSESARQGAVLMILSPLREGFIRILNTTASPVVFLSVLAAVCNVGSMAAMGKSGRHLLRRFLLLSTAMAAVTLIISSLIFQPQKTADLYSGGFHFGLLLDFILQFIPSGPISPLVEGDFPQLVLLALVLGTALLAAGARAGGLVSIVHEANSVGLLISGWVNRMAPFFIAVLLLLGVWDGSLAGLTGLWQPLAMFLLLCAVFLFLYLLRVGRKFRLPIKRLIRKMKDSFLIAFRNSSVDASYGANQLCCERRLGIDRKLTSFGLPLGLVIYMPAGTIAITLVTVYAARAYDVQVSSLWYIMTIFLTVALQAATPPMAGVGLLSYIVILSRLGIPTEALTVAMIADILFGFAVAAVDQAMLQLELLLEADRLDLLNRDVLKK